MAVRSAGNRDNRALLLIHGFPSSSDSFRNVIGPLAVDNFVIGGRHDSFYDLAETLSWMKALPRMQAHIFDGPHFLLETHPAECAELMSAIVASR